MKWGVGRKEDGGTVTLMTRKTPLGAEITVSDDGVGFDPEQRRKTERNTWDCSSSAAAYRRSAVQS